MWKLVKNDVYLQKSQKMPLLAYEMYQHETHFGFTKLESNMHPKGARRFYFCKNESRTPCIKQYFFTPERKIYLRFFLQF